MTALIPLDLPAIDNLTGGRLGCHDVACPDCGPDRRSIANQRREVLRIWRLSPTFASFHCARCGTAGHARAASAERPNAAAIAQARAEATERERIAALQRLGKARWLWEQRKPLAGSIAEKYLRQARAYSGELPATIGFLPARGKHGPAMIAAFGLAGEPDPGVLAIDDAAVIGVHITRLMVDGTGKAGTGTDKIMVGKPGGSPIVLAAPNDLLGMAVTEGIEDGLSVFEATGLGVWAAGSAGFMPDLAEVVPDYIEAVTIYAHDDPAGQQGAVSLAERITRRGIEVAIEGLS